MHVDGGFSRRAALLWRTLIENVDDIIVRLVELRLCEEGQETVVPAVPIRDEYFLAAVAGHLVGCFLQQCKLQFPAVGDSTGFMASFGDLTEIVFRKNDRILFL